MSDTTLGYKKLHPDIALNFMMNRMAWTIPANELTEVGKQITSLDDWVREMLAAGRRAEHDSRFAVAAKYYQGAEFYMAPDEDGKGDAYKRFIELHDRALPELAALRTNVPYEGGQLPVIDAPAKGTERGIILAHSGFDGLVEEMYPALAPFVEAGYRVIAFEGPGQGGALRFHGLHMPYDWERPVRAVLDHFDVKECTLVGMSLGGYLAPRAAAFEPRIKRVVSWGAMYAFFDCLKLRLGERKHRGLQTLLNFNARSIVNKALHRACEQDQFIRWATNHGMHVSGARDPFDYLKWMTSLNLREICPRITQDVLITHGTEDHLVGLDQFHRQAKSLTTARSVTTRLYTAQEHGAQHCQIGNANLVSQDILRWLEGLDQRDADLAQADAEVRQAA